MSGPLPLVELNPETTPAFQDRVVPKETGLAGWAALVHGLGIAAPVRAASTASGGFASRAASAKRTAGLLSTSVAGPKNGLPSNTRGRSRVDWCPRPDLRRGAQR